MTTPEHANSLVITWASPGFKLDDFKNLTSYLADLYGEVAAPYVANRINQELAPDEVPVYPKVNSIRMGSLTVELLTVIEDAPTILALGMVGYLLKHPEQIAGWPYKVIAEFYRQRGESWAAKRDYFKARHDCLVVMGTFDVNGQPVESFQRACSEEPGSWDRAARQGQIHTRREPLLPIVQKLPSVEPSDGSSYDPSSVGPPPAKGAGPGYVQQESSARKRVDGPERPGGRDGVSR